MAVKSIVRRVVSVVVLATMLVLPFLPPVRRLAEKMLQWMFIGQLAIAVGVTGLGLIVAVVLMIRDKRKRDRAAPPPANKSETA
ncbi:MULTISPECIES: hypothetical protein [unclassified Brevundimonas]|uniref:hypothetical protein n=1 Tax=unclassified Brevundimonas TaxID=2622653 RepID=UPI0025BA24D2|nr:MULTISPECIES: hypothetical protein [unclassified Brevundimonas]